MPGTQRHPENDRNNGCLCKSKETIGENKPKMGGCSWEDECSPNWISPEKCLWWPSKDLPTPDDCQDFTKDRFTGLVTPSVVK